MHERPEQRLTLSRPQPLAIIWKYRKVLLIGTLLGMLLGVAVALTRPKTYTASATILFPAAAASKLSALTGGGDSDLPSVPLLDGALQVPQPGTSTATAGILLQSRRTVQKIAEEMELHAVWDLPDEAAVLSRFRRELECKAGKNGDLTIQFRDASRELSYQVVERLVQELATLSRELGLNPAEQSEEFLKEQLVEAEKKWRHSQQALTDFQQQHRIISLPDQARGLAEQYSELQKNLVTAKLEAEAAERQANLQSDIARRLVTAFVNPAPSTTVTPLEALYRKMTDAESELALMRERLTPSHPDVEEKALALAETRRALKAEVDRQMRLVDSGSAPVVGATVVQAAVTRAKVDGLQSALLAVQQQVERLPKEQATYARLMTELEANLAEVRLFRTESEKARIIAARNGSPFIIADPPAPPLQRDPTHRLLFLLVMTLFGISVAALFPYAEWARQMAEYHDARAGMHIPA